MQDLGLTQRDVAIGIDCDQGQVSRLLSATKKPNTKTYKKMCAYIFAARSPSASEARRILDSAINRCWDGSIDDANSIARILEALSEYKRA